MNKTSVIILLLVLLLLLSACPQNGSHQDTDATELELLVHDLVNQHRNDQGLPSLELNQTIIDACREHSQNMGEGIVPFGYDGYEERSANLMNQLSLSAIAENVAFNSGYTNPGDTAVDGWINSSMHRANIEGNYNLTGIGVYQNSDQVYYFTQIFGRTAN